MANLLTELRDYEKHLKRKLAEAAGDRYEVEYYLEIGQHGHNGQYPSFNAAVTKAKQVYEEEVKSGDINVADEEESTTKYVGVSGPDKFAIVYITKYYLDRVVDPSAFGDRAAYNTFKLAATKYLKTNQLQMGKW